MCFEYNPNKQRKIYTQDSKSLPCLNVNGPKQRQSLQELWSSLALMQSEHKDQNDGNLCIIPSLRVVGPISCCCKENNEKKTHALDEPMDSWEIKVLPPIMWTIITIHK